MKNLRRSVTWPPGLLADALRAAGADLSTFVVGCALGVMTVAEQERVREVADLLHATAKEQMTKRLRKAGAERQRDRGRKERDKARELTAMINVLEAGDGVQFVTRPIFLRRDNIAALSDTAEAAGFLRLDQEQPMGSPLAPGHRARSFVAFLRAACAVEVERKAT